MTTTTSTDTAIEGRGATALLERTRSVVQPELRAAVATLPGPIRRVAMYHFGWEHADGTPSSGREGKAVRPALVLAAARALDGGRAGDAVRDAIRPAVAVELAHNFTLLHDDVIDEDPTRRHRATAWTVFGTPDAIVAGDAMMALAVRLLAEDPHPAASAASARLAACVVELCAGQQADCALERRDPRQVSVTECVTMATAKTGALLGASCALGGLYAGATAEQVAALDTFGREAGLAFQLIDDLMGIWGDPARTGKPAGADLAAHKKSLPVVHALASGTPAGAELAELYRRPMDETAVRRAADAVERAGGRDWAQEQAADRMAGAVHQLSRAVPDLAAGGDLLALAEFVTRRTS
ncbi:family 2 encapsulin nanocompartment cargo protein polyprenyl transferase [Streptomyces sp. NRRL F-5135]|uniref:family 2 encapsulin nanocompartment cargo protein polyprenyl transferase n=1 Tax=Streptomyces sp. NRRL F-5135 TaxID=1463858 RepID=UPI0004CA5F3C|nr:family 2 encapsulin nanocompartment cargo protein polyprenyl transferase [Streptomyces sp. NRRL F-5135]